MGNIVVDGMGREYARFGWYGTGRGMTCGRVEKHRESGREQSRDGMGLHDFLVGGETIGECQEYFGLEIGLE